MRALWIVAFVICVIHGLILCLAAIALALTYIMWPPGRAATLTETAAAWVLDPLWMISASLIACALAALGAFEAFQIKSYKWFIVPALLVAIAIAFSRLLAAWYVVNYGPIYIPGGNIMPTATHYQNTLDMIVFTQFSIYLAGAIWLWDAFLSRRLRSENAQMVKKRDVSRHSGS